MRPALAATIVAAAAIYVTCPYTRSFSCVAFWIVRLLTPPPEVSMAVIGTMTVTRVFDVVEVGDVFTSRTGGSKLKYGTVMVAV
jgi:hypothetical protein